MIEVVDRAPTYPGRIRLTPVPGQEGLYDMTRADEPTVDGTPINRALFESINADVTAINQNVVNLVNSHTSLGALGSLAAGTEFGIYEGGIWVPYIKVSGDYSGTGRSAVMRKHIYKMDFLTTGTEGTRYAGCYTDDWLNNEYLAMLESRVQNALTPVTIVCTVGNGSNATETIDRKIFVASMTEMGLSNTAYNVEGTPFPYFNSDERRLALFDGEVDYYWSRTTNKSYSGYMGVVDVQGYMAMSNPKKDQCGIRPVLTLPHNFEVNINVNMTANVMGTAEVI